MKLIFICIFSLLFIDIACRCEPKCYPGQKLECPKRTSSYPMTYCQRMSQCKCVKDNAYYNKLKKAEKFK